MFTVIAAPTSIAEDGGATTVTVSTGGVTFADDRQIALTLTGTATKGTDYTVDSETLTLTAGETSVATMVTAVQDAVDEEDETIDITAEGAQTRVTITDDDESMFTVIAAPTSIAEDGGATTVTVSTGGVTFADDRQIALTLTGTATKGTDYTVDSETLTLTAGETSVATMVTALDDAVDEGDETIDITAEGAQTRVTITDDDESMFTVIAAPTSIAEDGGATTVTVSTGGVTFADDRQIALTLTGTATKGTDYTVDSETLTLTAGETSVATMVTAVDDAVDEEDETIDITAEGAQTRVTITDDDESMFTVIAAPTSIAEDGGATTVTVSTGGVTFADDRQIELTLTGTATKGTDYTVDSETLTLTAGETSVATMVTAVDDAVDEEDETIDITAEGAQTRVTITDDDESMFTVIAAPTSIAEDGGATTVTVSTGGVTFADDRQIALTLTGTATKGTDYTVDSETLTLTAGETSVATMVTAVDDAVDEEDETIDITAEGAQTRVTITDDDESMFTVIAAPTSIAEDGGATTVTVSTGGVTFADDRQIALTLTGTATKGTDYTVDSETLTLTAGETSVATMVTAVQDAVDEEDETIDITAEGAQTRVTITDDDESMFTVIAAPTSIAEDGGATTVTVSTGGVTFADDRQIALTLTGTATKGTDYTVDSETLTLTAGETSVATMVTAVDDAVDEEDETIDITAEGAQTRVTITDDDESMFTAQSVQTLVSNMGQTQRSNVSVGGGDSYRIRAQAFMTGDNSNGYTLSSVQFYIAGGLQAQETVRVRIFGADASNNPGASLYSLTNPDPVQNLRNNTFDAPPNATLVKETMYFVVVEAPFGLWSIGVTASNAEDADKASSWSISNSGRNRLQSDPAGDWQTDSRSLRIRIEGTVNGTDATLSELTVNDGTNDLTLAPAFASEAFDYTTAVTDAVSQVTLTAETTDTDASVSAVTLDGSAIADDDFTDGITVPSLIVGENVIVVTVTAEDGSTTQTYTVTVTRGETANTVPTAADNTVTTDEDMAYTFAAADFNFDDTDSGDALASVTLVTLPAAGALELGGAPVTEDEVVAAADIGTLVFTPAANANGSAYASFTFKVSDGTDESASAYTMTVDVTPVNDAATGAPEITGTARVGEELTATIGTIADEDGLPGTFPDDYTFQWVRVDTANTETPVGTDSSAYTPEAADVDSTIRVEVSFTDNAGNAEDPLASAATAPVAALVPVLSTDATLSALTVNDGTTDHTIDLTTTPYEVDVGNTVTTVTLTATPAHTGASVSAVTLAGGTIDDDVFTDGITVPSLIEGANVIVVTVTAEDTTTTQTYTVTVTRQATTTVCTAPDLSGRMQIWTGTVTVGAYEDGGTVYQYGFGPGFGVLDDTQFSVGTNDYTVDLAIVEGSASPLEGQLSFSLTGALAAADLAQLTLHVCDASFALADAGVNTPAHTYNWSNSGLDWSSDTSRTLYLSVPGDTTAPQVTSIERQTPTTSPTNADSLTWRITFNEDVQNVDAADFTVSGTTATLAVREETASTVYDVTASGGDLASLDATVMLSFAGGQNITDTAGTALANTTPTGTNENTYDVDNTAPTVGITGVPATSSAPFTATFTFSEAVTGFVVGGIEVGNGAASDFMETSTSVYTALITPASDGLVTVDVAKDVAMDPAGNDNAAATQAMSEYTTPDTTAPQVTSIERQTPTTSPTNADSLTWRITFNEDVQNVDAADFTVSGTTATLAVREETASTVYDVTASGGDLASLDATVMLSFAGGQNITDTAGTALANTTPTGTNENTYDVDNTAPTVGITGVPATSSAPFTATFTFSEAVTGFVVGGIGVGNGAASDFMETNTSVYTALTPRRRTGR